MAIYGVSTVHKSHLISVLAGDSESSCLVLVPEERLANRICSNINTMCGREVAAVYPQKDYVFHDVEGVSREFEYQRLSVLGKLLAGDVKIVIATAPAACQYTLAPSRYESGSFVLRPGVEVDVSDLASKLVKAGYVRRSQVDGPAQFAVRGGIVDLFAPHMDSPVRIEFWGDEIDTISKFDLLSQRRGDSEEFISITPAREVLAEDIDDLIDKLQKSKGLDPDRKAADIERLQAGEEIISLDRYQAFCLPEKATLFDYIEGEIFACEYSDILTDLDNFTWQMNEDVETLLEQGLLGKKMGSFCENKGYLAANLQKRHSFFLETFSRSIPDIKLKDLIDFTAVSTSVWGGQYNLLKDELNDMVERGYCVMVMAGTEKSAKTLAADLSKDGYNAVFTTSGKDLVLGRVYVAEGTLTAGFEYPDARVGLITYNVINEKKSKTTARKIRKKDVINSLEDIAKGDYVVHVTHGIGQFDGVTQLELQGVKKDYLKLLYAGKDVLFVPVTQLDLVSKYVGGKAEGGLKLNKLYSAEWSRTKARVYSSVKDMADELVKLYAARSVAKGYAFSEDNDWQMEFEERFPYAETDDQLRSISEIKQDMQKPQPMDRILCGDVGFGKTEVALRAMFKCVLDSKQCAILVPTTILAYQHYQTILKRMGNFPVSVELLSRFRTPKQQKEIIQRIKTGQVDIVVGTHRVIQKDVKFKDLGLAIIDEEQRFGVAHKERFKQAFEGIDLLTLTATPIPRTLNMAMTGIRDISVIDEPPQNRHPIQTYVIEHDDRLIADAIKKELRRGGQVYYLYNRVETIEQCCSKIRAMVPEATVEFAHGKMSEKELSAKWAALLDGTIDVLVCTTIIETGVDVANANTLIIEDADRMGLSQLYQLRGRVGRSARRAYAYFTFKRGKVLTEIAAKRLEAIREFTTFGSGFKIAMRDLEIRGAGNLLGVQQHGHMDSVGYDMYLRLLNEAVAERTGQKAEQKNAECLVDIQVDAYIPKTYVESMQNRIDLYKKIATIENQAEADDIMDEIIDRFSDPPKSVQGLIDVALLRNRAAALNVKEIVQKDDRITLTLAAVDMEKISKIMAHWASRARFLASDTPAIVINMQKGDTPIKLIGDVLATLEDKSLPREEK